MVGHRGFFVVILIMIALFASTNIVRAETDIGDVTLHAKLASYMLTIPQEGQEYTLDCGKSENLVSVAPMTAPLVGSYYCVMNTSGKIIFGTFRNGADRDSDVISSEIINTYQDQLFNDHIPKTAIDTKGCGNYQDTSDGPLFQACKSGTITGMNAYVREELYGTDNIMFVLVSIKPLNQFDPNVFDTVLDWLKSFFGVENTAATQLEVLDHFDYAYFANVAHRHISAQWYGDSAFIIYQNFSTDMNTIKPDGSDYYPGHDNKQIISFNNFASTDYKNIIIWKKYTAGLRIVDDDKPPFKGDICGNGKIGFDEECDPGNGADILASTDSLTSCYDYDKLSYSAGTLKCNPVGSQRQCMYDTTDCVSCIDKDGDKFSGGQGSSGALSVVSYGKFGMGIPYGPFDAFDPDAITTQTSLLANRKIELRLGYEVVPITYDMAIPKGTFSDAQFTHSIALAETLYQNCLQRNAPTATTVQTKAMCTKEAYSNVTTFAPAINAEMAQIIPTASSESLCSFKEVQVGSSYEGRFFCPEGETPSALGIDSSLQDLLGNMKISNINPIIKINLGKPSGTITPGSCTGTHQACSGFSAATCEAHTGCTLSQQCVGSTSACGYRTSYACDADSSCMWTGPAGYNGVGFCEPRYDVSCDPTWDATTCESNGCSISSSCTGTAHTCNTITDATACNDLQHKGCSWSTGAVPADSKLPTKNAYSETELRTIHGYCFATAYGLSNYWLGIALTNSDEAKLKNFIIIGDPKKAGITNAQTYDDVYYSCRQGIKDAIGESARVLYGMPSNDTSYAAFTEPILRNTKQYDGIYIEPEIVCDGDCKTSDVASHKYVFKQMTKADYDKRYSELKDTNVSITALADISFDNDATNFGTKDFVDLVLAKTRPIIFNKDKSLSSFEGTGDTIQEIITNKTLYWNATTYGLQGKTIYVFKDIFVNNKSIPNAGNIRLFVADVGVRSSTITIHNFGQATQFNLSDFNLANCNELGTYILTKDNPIEKSKFNGTIPKNSIITINLGENVSCITPATGKIAACSARVDCVDDDPNDPAANPYSASINPGATEVCADGMDNNCNGAIDEAGCVPNGIDAPNTFVCNYVDGDGDGNLCDPGEDKILCRDCTAATDACPKQVLFKQYPGFNISLVSDNANKPTLQIVSTKGVCKLTGSLLKTTYQKTGTTPTTIFTNSTSSIKLSYLQDKWRLEPVGDLKSIKPCWGAFATTDIQFVSVPVCVPITGGTGDGCIANGCPSDTQYCDAITNRCRTDTTCFTGDTLVNVPNGKVPIKDLVVGDLVMVTDPDTMITRSSPILNIENKQNSNIRTIYFKTGFVETTKDHRFYTSNGWLAAGKLNVGDLLLHENGGWISITDITDTHTDASIPVYNLHVKDTAHTYYANGILVHNQKYAGCGTRTVCTQYQ